MTLAAGCGSAGRSGEAFPRPLPRPVSPGDSSPGSSLLPAARWYLQLSALSKSPDDLGLVVPVEHLDVPGLGCHERRPVRSCWRVAIHPPQVQGFCLLLQMLNVGDVELVDLLLKALNPYVGLVLLMLLLMLF
jgi:hypothetical protein